MKINNANLTKTVLNFYKKYSWLNVFVFVCVLGDFLILSASVLVR